MMNSSIPTWDLTALYSSLDDPSLARDLKIAQTAFLDLARLTESSPTHADQLPAILSEFNQVALDFSTPATYIDLKSMVEPLSLALSQKKQWATDIKNLRDKLWTNLLTLLENCSNKDFLLDDHPDLAAYQYPIAEFQRLEQHRPAPELRNLMTAMQQNGGHGWASLRSQLDAAAAAPLQPDTPPLPLSQLRGLASSPEKEIRRMAYEAELKLYPSYEIPMAACLNGIKGEAIQELSYKRYHSVEEEMLDVNKVSEETLTCMFRSIRAHLPHFQRYLKQKASFLGHTSGLPWYDLLAPMPGIPANFSFEAACEMLTDALRSFSPDLGQLAEKAINNRWIDALPVSGKQSGAICFDLPALRENRILLNYGGSFRCIRTMAHELGHAYHARCLDHIPLLLRDPPTPICETASLMNETIFLNKSLDLLPERQRFALLESDLQECTQTVLDIYSRYLFEKEVFARRENHELLPNELCGIMLDAQRETFGDSLNPHYLHPYMWMCKVHYYIPEFHYYNYPYIFGLLLAKGLYAQYMEHPAGFTSIYHNLLSETCSGNLEDVLFRNQIDICTQQFWDNALDLIAKDISHWCDLADQRCKD